MSRVYNFAAGPAALPLEVLQTAASELVEYGSSGMSVMEMSHRSAMFKDIITEAEELLRNLLSIPDNYKVLFLQGGASLQFSMIPMNLMTANKKCDFIDTGVWTEKAITEAKKFGEVTILASSGGSSYNYIPETDGLSYSSDADYLHICWNNTIYGTKYTRVPGRDGVPLIADMSSCILSEKINIEDFDLIFAGAQKNIGPAGLTIVIIKDDLLDRSPQGLPSMLDFNTHVKTGSMFNTPPTYSIYIAMLVFRWIMKAGGLTAMEDRNREKARILYDCIDGSDLFSANVRDDSRSLMNVTFSAGSDELNGKFIEEAARHSLKSLAGHKTAGGMRASIYNAMSIEGVEALAAFMKKFEAGNR